jgi:hypothetical protein
MSRNSKTKRDNRRKQKKPKNPNEGHIIHFGRNSSIEDGLNIVFNRIFSWLVIFIPVLLKEEVEIKEITIKRLSSLYLKLCNKGVVPKLPISEELLFIFCSVALKTFNGIKTDEDLQKYINNKKEELLGAYLEDLKKICNKETIELNNILTEIVREEFKKDGE